MRLATLGDGKCNPMCVQIGTVVGAAVGLSVVEACSQNSLGLADKSGSELHVLCTEGSLQAK